MKTDKLYVDTDKPVEQMSLEEAKRGMCAAAGNDVLKCESCTAKCKFGRRIVELLKPVEMERTEKKVDYRKAVEAMNAKRKQKSTKAYLSAIASGDPRQWFVDNGYDPKNAMVRLRKNYGDVTQEEAQARLDAKGTNLPMYEHTVAAKPVEKSPEAKVQPAPEPAKAVQRLRITQLDGEYFAYTLTDGSLYMNSDAGAVRIKITEVAAMCEEIQQAAAMMKGQ